jgi:hypothetical protein
MALKAAMQGAAAKIGDGVLQATEHIVQGQQSLLPERNHDGFLGRRQHGAFRRLRTHGLVGRRGPLAPFANRFRVQAVVGGKGAPFDAWSSARIRGVVRALP